MDSSRQACRAAVLAVLALAGCGRHGFEHRSPGGSTVRDRVAANRYKWRNLGENLAGGNRSIGEAVAMWLDSPDHCENLMDAKFADVAVACVAQPGTELGTYWTMVLGRK